MKTLLISIVLLAASFINTRANTPSGATPPDSATYKLTVTFANVDKRAGMIYVGVVSKGTDINGDSYRKTRVAVPATGDFQVSFEGLPAGEYAVKVYQDLNDNMKLDMSNNMPSEPFGFSNMKMLLGPPSFSQCAFDLNAPKTITIRLLNQ